MAKIAILGTRGIPARYGGFETFAERLAVGLCARGFDVTVFCESDKTSRSDTLDGVHLKYQSSPQLGPFRTILFDLRCLWAARSGYDVVYMLGYGAAPFCLLPRMWGSEVWINPDGLEWARAKWSFAARAYFRLMEWVSTRVASRLIADSGAIAESLSSRHGRLRACSVIAYGCDIIHAAPDVELLSEWNLAPAGYYLVVCRLEPENHIMEILRAFQLSNSEKKLVVVGNHLAGTRYVEQLRGVQDSRIRLIGTVYDHAKLVSLRYHSFAYLHGHSVGGTNPSLLEAMGCGNLIVAHDNPFNRETLATSALFFEGVEDLKEIVKRIESCNFDAPKMRLETRQRAADHYSWPAIVEQYTDLLNSTLLHR